MINETKNTFKTTCCYCGVGCGIVIKDLGKGKILVEGDKDHPVNRGMLCSKGMNLHYTVMDKSDRLLEPQMRMNRSMPMQNVSWDEALDRTAAIFKAFIKQYGPESVAFYVSGQCLTEEYYLWNKVMKGFIGSNNIDTNSRLCMSSAVVGYKLSLGEDAVPVCYDDIELSDILMVSGANPAWCHPIIWRRVEAHKADNPKVKIICVDPRKTQTAEAADLHLAINPGSDVTLNHAIGRILIENGDIDIAFLQNHADGFEAYKIKVFERTLTESSEICGVAAADITLAAKWIGDAKGFLSMWTMGLNQSVIGVNKNLSLINLNLITGKIGKPGNGPFSLTGQPNAMGGREVGGLANMLASHRELANPAHRQEMQDFWGGTVISEKPGLTATEMFASLKEGKLKAIWITCTNPLVSLPDLGLTEEALKMAKFVVVQDISSRSDTLAFADVILPAAAWSEKEGTMTNAERRISYLSKISEPPGQAKPDVDIIISFAQKMGWKKQFNYKSTEAVYFEYIQSTKGTNIDISDLNYDILKQGTVQWPYKKGSFQDEFGTKRLFSDHIFYTNNTKAQIHAVPDENLSEALSSDFPLILLTGRIRDQWHTMTKTGRVNKLNQHESQPFVSMHPADALSRNIEKGDVVIIQSKRGETQLKVQLSGDNKPGTAFMPMHWGRILGSTFGRTNNLSIVLVDPRSKEPDFKYSAIQIQKYIKPAEKIIIIGAGSASLGFINEYRKWNATDEITIFNKEKNTFYNRVMLPDYISGTQTWDQLLKLRQKQFENFNLVVNAGRAIVEIRPESKTVIDELGEEHSYTKLILATGSRAFMPKNFPVLPGIFNMRNRVDADNLQKFIFPGAHAVVVGGGLLGLELAASLREINVEVTLVQRISRLMDRQLDIIGSEILHEEIVKRGIDVYYNDEVEYFYGSQELEGIRLKSGKKISCSAIIVAAGTIPNIEVAQKAGLASNRGIMVNDYMQTSDPDIFACGEIAEWKTQMWGITAAAEQQAAVAAKFLNGDFASFYGGSLSMNILKMLDLNLCSLGLVESPPNDDSYEEIVFLDRSKHYYKKCIIRNDRLVGAILMGDKSEFLEFKNLIENGIELSEKRLKLLRSNQSVEPIIGKLVCSCNNVGEGNLQNAIKKEHESIEQLCAFTGAGTGCGSCKPEVLKILENSISTKTIELAYE
jgi:ferredoxin-nitrate reductase